MPPWPPPCRARSTARTSVRVAAPPAAVVSADSMGGSPMRLRRTLLATALLLATGVAASGAAAAADDGIPTGPLPRTVVPSEVGLTLTIDPAQPRFSGHVEISVDVARATD